MIKFKLRKNLIYLFVYYISWYVRKIVTIIFENTFDFYPSFIFLFLMTLGEIFGGLTIFLYQYISLKRKKDSKIFTIKSIYDSEDKKVGDHLLKKIILVFFAAFFDFMEFVISTFFLSPFDNNISPSFDLRFGAITTISSSLLCIYALKAKTGKHQIISQRIMIMCLLISLIFELCYKSDNVSFGNCLVARLLCFGYLICISYNDCIEKYLVNTNFTSPFKIVMIEGIFEFIMSSFLSIGKAPFKEIKMKYNEISPGYFVLLIFLFILYLILSAILNSYKIYCNVIYSPMAKSLMDYLMSPFFCIYYFIRDNDFNKNYFYFFISEFIVIIIVFFGCVYNEYIILYCFDMERETIDEIIERANLLENIPDKNNLCADYDDEDDDISEYKINFE